MEAGFTDTAPKRPLIAGLESLRHEQDASSQHDGTDARLVQLLGEFFRGGKEKRRALLHASTTQGQTGEDAEDDEDRYEPQRLTRKIHWQYDRSMKKVPMLRRDYIG